MSERDGLCLTCDGDGWVYKLRSLNDRAVEETLTLAQLRERPATQRNLAQIRRCDACGGRRS